MGKIDIEAKKYFSDLERFADIFNFFIYKGKTIIKPDSLREVDPTEVAVVFGNKEITPIQKFRDLLKFYTSLQDDRAIYLLFGLELESKTHYAMPVRGMLYDAMNYTRQIEKIAAIHRAEKSTKKITSDEFLSGFWKEDHLVPVLTLTINITTNQWDGANSLHEMFDIHDQALLGLIPNYRLNLLSPDKIDEEDFDKFKTGIGSLMQFIKHKNDKNMNWIQGKKRFEHIDRGTADFIQTVTGVPMQINSNEEVVNVCKAWENSMNEARDKGIKKGRDEATRENVKSFYANGFSIEQICKGLGLEKKSVEIILKS